ncbi:MAG TPA: caspase family protein, partial [Methylomirabilota bacterium]|nr:caspase family protein [Methylomirabilota bacterium]
MLLAGLVSVAAPPCRAQSDVKLYEKRYALVVGIGTYENKHPDKKSWPSLPNAKGDAESVAKLLGKMGFEVTTLYNEDADRKGIMSKLNWFAKNLG